MMVNVQQRIVGYDVARALATFIMIIVNFHLVLATVQGEGVIQHILGLLQGKGAALFIVLAGVGISLMTRKSFITSDKLKLKENQQLLLKRALFLFVFGLLYTPLWPADILHNYGIYISVGAFLITSGSRKLWFSIFLLILLYPILISLIDYETGWNWDTNEYSGFWTVKGFIRNLFFNGFHPIIPWLAFLLTGIWLGRQNMANKQTKRIILLISAIVFCSTQIGSQLLIYISTSYLDFTVEDAITIFGTAPLPPMPLFMISGISWSFMVIICCIWVTENTKGSFYFLVRTGQMAFTHYILHVLVGILSAYLLFGENNLSPLITLFYAIGFCICSVVLSVQWTKRFKKGPMATVMRFIAG
jgi:uncharacterized membrane protein YeiB